MSEVSELLIRRGTSVRDALAALDRTGSGILLLVDDDGRFERTVTDGDLRRMILAGAPLETAIQSLPRIVSITVPDGIPPQEALALMNERQIDRLPAIDANGRVTALIDRRNIGERIQLSTPHMGKAERRFVDEAFDTNWIAPLGPNVDAFESEMANYVGISHAAALSSGTAAIHLALRLLGVGPGDTVFCSSFTFVASAAPIVYQGAEPVFIDSEPESWNMSPAALERAFAAAVSEGKLPRAVVVVNLYGQSADYDRLSEICGRYGVPIMEDAAESLGALYKGGQSGRFGKFAALSFNGNKIITTSGGGMLLSEDEEAIERARFLATQARDPAPHYQHSELGYNYRLSNILAGVGRGQLQVLADRIAARRRVFDTYCERLGGIPGLEWMPEPEWSFSNRWLSTMTIDPNAVGLTADALRIRLSEALIETRPLWKPMHQQPVFSGARYFAHGNVSVSDDLFDRGLCLPSGSNMTEGDLDRICDQINAIVARAA